MQLFFALASCHILPTYRKAKRTADFYIESSSDPERRVQEHNWSRTTSKKTGIPRKIVYTEEYETRSEAVSREYQIKKKKSRKYIEYLIKLES